MYTDVDWREGRGVVKISINYGGQVRICPQKQFFFMKNLTIFLQRQNLWSLITGTMRYFYTVYYPSKGAIIEVFCDVLLGWENIHHD